jgi:eukaryotic-like serine/threonine-protein kinase
MRSKVGHYDVVEELGRGGMGVVYKGFESALNRHVAIKLMSESLAHDQQIVERFLREARSMAQLNDPHIIQIYMIGEDSGQPFFAMEFVEGESLSQTLRREGRIEPKRAMGIIAQAAQGLSVAHDRGVVHRDIKPANLMLTPRGLVKVADFGIALSHDFDKKLTGTGEFVGTPGYLSPEVCLGKTVDQRSDVFSLGIVLFEMLAGQMPFTDQSPLGLMLEVVRAEIPDVRSLGANVSPELVAILNRMLAKDPDQRYGSCHDLLADINHSGLLTGAQNIAMPQAGITSAATLPQQARAPQPATAPRGQIPAAAQPPQIPAATLASRIPTPAPQPQLPPAMLAAPSHQQAPAYQQAPQYQQQYQQAPVRKSGILPWAIAASLLAGGGGAAYYFKDRLMPAQTAKDETTQSDPVSKLADAPTIATSDVPNNTPSTDATTPVASNEPTTSSNASSENTGAVGADSTAQTMPANSTASTEVATQLAEMQQKQEATERELAALKQQQATSTESTATSNQRQPLAGLQERVENIDKSELSPRGQTRVATTQTTPTVAAQPRFSTGVAVIAAGDMGAAGAAEQAIEDALSNAGYTSRSGDASNRISGCEARWCDCGDISARH